MTEITGRLRGPFTGYNGGAIFQLTNGQAWQQARHKYKYKYKYRPQVCLYQDGGRWMMEVDCMDDAVEVRKVSVIYSSVITSDFTGFSGDSLFEFDDGSVWKQDEYKYEYHYAHRPGAIVVDGLNGTELHVDGMSESIRVRRVR